MVMQPRSPLVKHGCQEYETWTDAGFQDAQEETIRQQASKVICGSQTEQHAAPENDKDAASASYTKLLEDHVDGELAHHVPDIEDSREPRVLVSDEVSICLHPP